MSIRKTYIYTKLRKSFGRQPLYRDVPPHFLDSIYPSAAEARDYVLRNPVHRAVQAAAGQAEHEAGTGRVQRADAGVNHVEGGWPRDVHRDNEEHVHRHTRRVLHDDRYVHTVMALEPPLQHYINQNNAIDMYETYFTHLPHQPPVETYEIKVTSAFRDALERPVSCITWTNEQEASLAVSYCFKVYPSRPDDDLSVCASVWNIERQDYPEFNLKSKTNCWQITCSPVDPTVFVTGHEDGTIGLFDIRESKTATSSTSIYNSHSGPVTALHFMHTRSNAEFFTGSLDGQCLWWDLRNLSTPTSSVIICPKLPKTSLPTLNDSESVTSLNYDRNLPTKLLCGTDSGLVVSVNRMGKDQSELINGYWNAHTGPVRSVQRSHCTLRMFITCGDYNVNIWSDEVRSSPIITSKTFNHIINDACWTPLKYCGYLSAHDDGTFAYSDPLRRYKSPLATLKVSQYGLLKISPHQQGELVATGDYKGCVYLLKLSDSMVYPLDKEKARMSGVYLRETKREHILEARKRELRLKAKADEQMDTMLGTEMDEMEEDEEQMFEMVTEEYWKVVQKAKNQFDTARISY